MCIALKKFPIFAISAMAAATSATLTHLFVSSYAGNITTLALTQKEGCYEFDTIAVNPTCGPNPSWLTIDTENRVLYCLDEGLDVPNGSLNSFQIDHDGSLKRVERAETLNGPVSGAIYNKQTGLAIAHYSGSALSSWTLSKTKPGRFSNKQNIIFKLDRPGPNPDRQDAPHEHEAFVDPSGQYILVPDLGADLVRVYGHDGSGKLVAKPSLKVVPGSGPRHGAFVGRDNTGHFPANTYMFIVTELGNTITSYAVSYLPNTGGLAFKEVYTSSVYGNLPLPSGNTAAEVAVSPDDRFVIISNRNNTSFELSNPDPKNKTKIASDSLSSFAINPDGTLSFRQLVPAGGSFPRQFALNAAGDLVAVGLQYSSTVSLLKRDVKTGQIGDIAAQIAVPGNVTCVRWDEKTQDGTFSNA